MRQVVHQLPPPPQALPMHLSPPPLSEMYGKDQYNGYKADIWSCGVCLIMMLSSRDLCSSNAEMQSLSQSMTIAADVCGKLDESSNTSLGMLIDWMLHHDFERRPFARDVVLHPACAGVL